jgi:hypothetical protein
MIAPSAPEARVSLAFIEGAMTAITVGLAFALPSLGAPWFKSIERVFGQLARRRSWAVAAVGVTAFLLRVAILPLCPIPLPFVPDDFSFLLAADTFAHGRLANPTPAMWMHFESIHITMIPTYVSMYFPMHSLVLAAGQVVTGQPWFGLLVVTALMCAAVCWMLQAWLPPGWALLGGVIAIVRLGLFSYWINTFNGGASVAALGGALVLGALPRLMRTLRRRDALLMAIGMSILVLSRPFEGLLLCIPVGIVLGRWILMGKNPFGRRRPEVRLLLRRAALPLAVIVATLAWLAYYDYRAFGSPTTLPYTVDRATYAVTPYFIWQAPRPVPVYRHQALRTFYTVNELEYFNLIHTPLGFLRMMLAKLPIPFLFFAGFTLLTPLVMLHRALMDRRIRFLIQCVLLLSAGMLIQLFLIPHYVAPFTAAFYAIGLQAMRHLRLWEPGDKAVGLSLVRLIVTLCFVLVGLRLTAGPLHLAMEEWPPAAWNLWWYGPGHFGVPRAVLEAKLEELPGKQLVIVRYAPGHNVLDEWVYNASDIDHSKVIWAREMDQANNEALIQYYKDRQVLLVQPDQSPAALSSYSIPDISNSSAKPEVR